MTLEKKYAQALDSLTKDKSSEDINIIFSNFISVLKKKGHYAILPKILKSLKNIRQKKELDNIEFIVASKEQESKFRPRFNDFKKYFDEKEEVKIEIDKTIVGGFIIKSKSIIIDGSYKKALINLYGRLL